MPGLTRRGLFKLGVGALAGSMANGRSRSFGRAEGAKPKNVLLLMSDAHRPTGLGIMGDPFARTPQLDALARSGVLFEYAFCTNPVCLPSRASLMTGLYTHHHRAYDNGTPWPFELKTWGHYFHKAGYRTAFIGKHHFADSQTHGFDYIESFNDWYAYLGPKLPIRAQECYCPMSGGGWPDILPVWRSRDPWKDSLAWDGRMGSDALGRISLLPEEDHFESFVAREAIYFLENYGKDRPFLLVASFLKPHDPHMPAERFGQLFRPEDMRLPDTWGKVDLSTVPRVIRHDIEVPRGTPELIDPRMAKVRMAMYYADLAQMDDALGQVLNPLRDLNLADDTIVLYTADHGEMFGEHGLWLKNNFYESSVGVPLIFRVPGLTPPNSRSQTPVSQVQVLATLAELCDLEKPSGLDGDSFVSDLRQPSLTRDTTIYAEYNLKTPEPRGMIRRGDYKYCYYTNDIAELYDLRNDPKEMHNLALDPKYQRKAEELKAALFARHRLDEEVAQEPPHDVKWAWRPTETGCGHTLKATWPRPRMDAGPK
jgi:choline-sulfatase